MHFIIRFEKQLSYFLQTQFNHYIRQFSHPILPSAGIRSLKGGKRCNFVQKNKENETVCIIVFGLHAYVLVCAELY